jgi:hypothetical protein
MQKIKAVIFIFFLGIFFITYSENLVSDLIKLYESGVSDDVLIAYIQSYPKKQALSADEIVTLKQSGISEAVISEALRNSPKSTTKKIATLNTADGAVEEQPSEEEQESTTKSTAKEEKTVFEDALSPYGTWIFIDGVRYWKPYVVLENPNWAPYFTNGHWVYSEVGWMWVSNYPWGWAVFHYGRWHKHPIHGWIWWPDITWGPAWVIWRSGDIYCGWAPLPPFTVFVPNKGFFFKGRFVGDDFDFNITVDNFFFVPTKNICDQDVWLKRIEKRHHQHAFSTTVVVTNNFAFVNNRIVTHGPSVELIAKVSGAPIVPAKVEIIDIDRPAHSFKGVVFSSGRVVVERPRVTIMAPIVAPIPAVKVIDNSPQGRTDVVRSKSGFEPTNENESKGFKKKSSDKSEGFNHTHPSSGKKGKSKGFKAYDDD